MYKKDREVTQKLLVLPPLSSPGTTLCFLPLRKKTNKHNQRIPWEITLISYTDEMHSNYVNHTLQQCPIKLIKWEPLPTNLLEHLQPAEKAKKTLF